MNDFSLEKSPVDNNDGNVPPNPPCIPSDNTTEAMGPSSSTTNGDGNSSPASANNFIQNTMNDQTLDDLIEDEEYKQKQIQKAARVLYESEILLVVTGAGFSADSGLATYIDVADIKAYRDKGWRYRDLCRPLPYSTWGHSSSKKVSSGKACNVCDGQSSFEDKVASNAGDVDQIEEQQQKGLMQQQLLDEEGKPGKQQGSNTVVGPNGMAVDATDFPNPESIFHPQWFYGFWGQCCNDYRSIGPHDGYDIIAKWAKHKNFETDFVEDDNSSGGGRGDIEEDHTEPYHELGASVVAREMRKYIHHFETVKHTRKSHDQSRNQRNHERHEERDRDQNRETGSDADKDVWVDENGNVWMEDEDSDDDSSDDGDNFFFSSCAENEPEPYFVSDTNRAGAFFFFTSNVDAHAYDVLPSHEIRECHGNVELWQCCDFGCGTNATTNKQYRGAEDNNDSEKIQKGWQRRVWRLPLDFRFEVDKNTMSAPCLKTVSSEVGVSQQDKEVLPPSMSDADTAESLENAGTRTPSPKRMKSSKDTADKDANLKHNNNGNVTSGEKQSGFANKQSSTGEDESDKPISPSHVGDVHGKPRLHPLRHMRSPSASINDYDVGVDSDFFLPISPESNWPTCPRCKNAARPAVLMFEDLDWVYNLNQEQRWRCWTHALLSLCKKRALNSNSDQSSKPSLPLKVCILEVGCGYNVPTCRRMSEGLVEELSYHGGEMKLIRINLFHPEADDPSVEDDVISIPERGLVALKKIDEVYEHIRNSSSKILIPEGKG